LELQAVVFPLIGEYQSGISGPGRINQRSVAYHKSNRGSMERTGNREENRLPAMIALDSELFK
jgi:hypothetical protein